MPLPLKVIEQLGREPARTPGAPLRLIMFAATVFFVSAFSYLGLIFGYKPFLDSKIEEINKEIENFKKEVSVDDQLKLISYYSQLVNLGKLLDDHIYASPLFSWLEKNTHSKVYYTKFALNLGSRELQLGGISSSPLDVAEQVKIFDSQKEVDRVVFKSASVGQGGLWQFDMTLFLKRDIFKNPNLAVEPVSPEGSGVSPESGETAPSGGNGVTPSLE